ncbi:MAG: UDP-N-acetylmuramoyl-tripeptide--D-alanyl-D-alanine ligase [Desulfovibrionaceae bacterium]
MFTLRDMETALLGAPDTPVGRDFAVTGVATDSRSVNKGDAFFCIEGENFDGHHFAPQAVKHGARVVVASRLMPELERTPVLLVPDTVLALGRLAAFRRQGTHARVVAVTGSAGKTTVKELLASVAGHGLAVSKSAGNFNNQIGLPLSIFRAADDADLWILELGISKPHDMDELGPVAAPDLAVIHNIGPAHLEGLGSIEGVARAKASLLRHLAPGGRAVVNRDYPELWAEATAIRPDAVGFSTTDPDCDYFCTLTGRTPEGRGLFRVKTRAMDETLELPACGAHHAENVAAVACAAHLLGLAPSALREGLAESRALKQRFVCRTQGRMTLIDDTYNANPKSMLAAMRAAKDMAEGRPLVLVLGEMKELGELAAEEHKALGRAARELAPALLLWKGAHADDVAEGFGPASPAMAPTASPAETARRFASLGLGEAVVLVKGSRSCRMEEHAAALTQCMFNKDAA